MKQFSDEMIIYRVTVDEGRTVIAKVSHAILTYKVGGAESPLGISTVGLKIDLTARPVKDKMH